MASRILLVDDHELTRVGLSLLFAERAEYEIVGLLEDGASVLNFIKTHEIDIVILDLQLSDMNGISLLADLVGAYDMTVIILTGQRNSNDCSLSLKMGARGVVSKADPSEEVLEALEHALQGEVYLSSSIRKKLRKSGSLNVKLSPRQMAILHYMASGESNKEIGYRLNIAIPTVSFHIGELREKLGVSSNRKIVPYAMEIGLI